MVLWSKIIKERPRVTTTESVQSEEVSRHEVNENTNVLFLFVISKLIGNITRLQKTKMTEHTSSYCD